MKITPLCFAFCLVSLTACSTLKRHSPRTPPAKADPPETVIVTYHVKAGQEAALQDTLARAWAIYQKEHMVLPQPHVIVRDNEKMENGGQTPRSVGVAGDNRAGAVPDAPARTRFIEIFTWVNHAKPAHAPDSVKTIWNQMQSFCEPRDGHPGLDGGEVELLIPAVPAAKP